jgi:hypothetical protein
MIDKRVNKRTPDDMAQARARNEVRKARTIAVTVNTQIIDCSNSVCVEGVKQFQNFYCEIEQFIKSEPGIQVLDTHQEICHLREEVSRIIRFTTDNEITINVRDSLFELHMPVCLIPAKYDADDFNSRFWTGKPDDNESEKNELAADLISFNVDFPSGNIVSQNLYSDALKEVKRLIRTIF